MTEPISLPPKRSSRGWVIGLFVVMAVCGGAASAFLLSKPNSTGPGPSTAVVVPAPPIRSTPAPVASEPPAPTESKPVVEAAAPTAELDDGSSLGPTYGYLVVSSTETEGQIYASGVKVGPVGKKNQTPCGMRYVRIGKGEPPTWIGEGKSVDVKCRATTEVKLPPPQR